MSFIYYKLVCLSNVLYFIIHDFFCSSQAINANFANSFLPLIIGKFVFLFFISSLETFHFLKPLKWTLLFFCKYLQYLLFSKTSCDCHYIFQLLQLIPSFLCCFIFCRVKHIICIRCVLTNSICLFCNFILSLAFAMSDLTICFHEIAIVCSIVLTNCIRTTP